MIMDSEHVDAIASAVASKTVFNITMIGLLS